MSAKIKTWEQLRAAAKGCEGWSWPDRRRDENGTHHFGQLRDGGFYDMGTIDAWTYTSEYADDIRVLKFIRAAQPKTILKLLDELDELRAALAATAPTVAVDAEEYLRNRYGAYRGHHAWRELEEAFNAGRAKLSAGVAIPEGWALVPVEPTIEMVAALGWAGDEDLAVGHAWISNGIADDYKAMLAAAPSPDQQGE